MEPSRQSLADFGIVDVDPKHAVTDPKTLDARDAAKFFLGRCLEGFEVNKFKIRVHASSIPETSKDLDAKAIQHRSNRRSKRGTRSAPNQQCDRSPGHRIHHQRARITAVAKGSANPRNSQLPLEEGQPRTIPDSDIRVTVEYSTQRMEGCTAVFTNGLEQCWCHNGLDNGSDGENPRVHIGGVQYPGNGCVYIVGGPTEAEGLEVSEDRNRTARVSSVHWARLQDRLSFRSIIAVGQDVVVRENVHRAVLGALPRQAA